MPKAKSLREEVMGEGEAQTTSPVPEGHTVATETNQGTDHLTEDLRERTVVVRPAFRRGPLDCTETVARAWTGNVFRT
jgi:hypothetical protein